MISAVDILVFLLLPHFISTLKMRSEYACIFKLFFLLNDLSCSYFLSKKLEKKHKESVIAQGWGHPGRLSGGAEVS